MSFKKIFDELNIIAKCQNYSIPVWQCPQFLFFIMGIVIIFVILLIFSLGAFFVENSEFLALITLVSTFILFVVGNIIIQSFERLAEANRMKTEFIGIVSHQLRTPITNLKWTIDILKSSKKEVITDKDQTEKQEYFKILEDNSIRMAELVNQLITVSRIQKGVFLFKKEKINLVEITKQLIQEAKSFIKKMDVKVEFDFDEDLPIIVGDRFQIRTVVENLLNNAIHYSSKKNSVVSGKEIKKVEINIRKIRNKICFKIKDNGIGISKMDEKYIFQKFFRAKNASKHKTEGSGLGLYIARSIIEELNGELDFKSKEDCGSIFWFTLPTK